MSRKKRNYQPKPEQKKNSSGFNNKIFHLESEILSILDESQTPLEEESFVKNLAHHNKNELQNALATLTRLAFIQQKKGCYQISVKAPLVRGKLSQNSKGFGFVSVDGIGSKKAEKNDPYIPKQEINGAIHGDRVLIRPLPGAKKGRPEFSVVRIIDPAPDTLCGILREKQGSYLVVPDDSRIPFKVRINQEELQGAHPGDVVKVKFERDFSTKNVPGHILTILGSPALIDTQMQLTIEKFDLPHEFSKAAVGNAKKLTFDSDLDGSRVDLRDKAHVTIDGATAKDFDDAICIEQKGEITRLFVSIADVSHYVLSNTALDNEAYERGTSVYFPGRVIPMLPEELSNDLCSLIPEVDRLTMTAEMEFTPSGKLLKKKIYPSIICSKRRFTYSRVWELLQGEESGEDAPFLPMLQAAEKLASLLRKLRFARGSIDFNLREPVYTLDDHGGVAAIKAAERNDAHRLIEEFMLIANETVAEYLGTHLPTPIFRIHEKPNSMKIKEFQSFAGRLGEQLPKFNKDPKWFSEVLDRFKGGRYEYIINNLLLRSLTQAQYSTEPNGHFGLASPAYTHFTSPIRRYPDLIVHRMLKAILEAKGKKSRKQKFAPQSTAEAAEFLSGRERVAVDAERDMNDRLKVAYMKDKLGEKFAATISGVSESSLFVELAEPCVSGAIPVEMLGDDYFFFDEKNFRLFGEISRREYQLGDELQVILTDVSMSRRQLTFIPFREEQ